MRKQIRALLVIGLGAATYVGAVAATPAGATIHPLVASACASPQAEANVDPQEPPGQTPGGQHADQSTLRALQATGLLTFAGEDPVINVDIPASKWIAPFVPDPEFAAFAHCTNPAGIPETP